MAAWISALTTTWCTLVACTLTGRRLADQRRPPREVMPVQCVQACRSCTHVCFGLRACPHTTATATAGLVRCPHPRPLRASDARVSVLWQASKLLLTLPLIVHGHVVLRQPLFVRQLIAQDVAVPAPPSVPVRPVFVSNLRTGALSWAWRPRRGGGIQRVKRLPCPAAHAMQGMTAAGDVTSAADPTGPEMRRQAGRRGAGRSQPASPCGPRTGTPTWPPPLPRPYCRPSWKPQSKSTLMGRSSSWAPLMYLTASSASCRVKYSTKQKPQGVRFTLSRPITMRLTDPAVEKICAGHLAAKRCRLAGAQAQRGPPALLGCCSAVGGTPPAHPKPTSRICSSVVKNDRLPMYSVGLVRRHSSNSSWPPLKRLSRYWLIVGFSSWAGAKRQRRRWASAHHPPARPGLSRAAAAHLEDPGHQAAHSRMVPCAVWPPALSPVARPGAGTGKASKQGQHGAVGGLFGRPLPADCPRCGPVSRAEASDHRCAAGRHCRARNRWTREAAHTVRAAWPCPAACRGLSRHRPAPRGQGPAAGAAAAATSPARPWRTQSPPRSARREDQCGAPAGQRGRAARSPEQEQGEPECQTAGSLTHQRARRVPHQQLVDCAPSWGLPRAPAAAGSRPATPATAASRTMPPARGRSHCPARTRRPPASARARRPRRPRRASCAPLASASSACGRAGSVRS